jgi:hypothetical protein
MKITRIAFLLFFMSSAAFDLVRADNGHQAASVPAEQATDAWHKEFDEICSKTQDAMTLSSADLTDLIRRCDALAPQVEKLNESQKKLYLGRLRMCRGLYAYVLETKQKETSGDAKKDEKK